MVKKKEKADILEVYPDSAKKELEAIPEVYAILDDDKKKELKDDNVFEFTNQILDTTQEEVSKTDDNPTGKIYSKMGKMPLVGMIFKNRHHLKSSKTISSSVSFITTILFINTCHNSIL